MPRLRCTECHEPMVNARAGALTCSPACRTARHRRLHAQTPAWPTGGPFDLIMVDLPLSWTGWSAKGEGRAPQRHYATMDIPALIGMRPMIEAVTACDAAFCCWVYGPRLPDTLKVIEGWGLTFKGELLTWFKTGNLGLGLTTRKCVENAWLATRGKGLPIRHHGIRQNIDTRESPLTIEAPRGIHSAKPDEAYVALERLYGDVQRLDLFARRRRGGWTAWGDEVTPPPPAAGARRSPEPAPSSHGP
jgi:N6-adenosine-specific RNA methylase IME4